jgi:hypothetical protein
MCLVEIGRRPSLAPSRKRPGFRRARSRDNRGSSARGTWDMATKTALHYLPHVFSPLSGMFISLRDDCCCTRSDCHCPVTGADVWRRKIDDVISTSTH